MLKTNPYNTLLVKKIFTINVSLFCAAFIFSSAVYADSTTFTGSTGLITTPDALIAETGQFSLQYNNYIEDRFSDDFTNGSNYIFTLGAYPRFEIAGRLTDYDSVGERYSTLGTLRGKRDLSANVKFNVFKNSDFFWISVGGKDIAGLAQNFTSYYGVVSGKWKNALLSLGAATGDNESFDGVFGSASYRFNRNLKIAFEVDTESSLNGGIVATLPWRKNLELDATLVGVNGEAKAGLTARFALGRPSYSELLVGGDPVNASLPSSDNKNKLVQHPIKGGNPTENLANFTSSLADLGLQRVRVGGNSEGQYIVEFENRVYRYSDYDAITDIAILAKKYLPQNSRVETVLIENGLIKYRDSLNLGKAQSQLTRNTTTSNQYERSNIPWIIPRKSNDRVLGEFFAEPALVSAVGTEFGTIDFSLAARVGVSIPLWRGARAVVASYLPLYNTKNFESGNPYSQRAFETSLERATFVQYLPLAKRIHTQLELGQVQLRGFDYTAVKAQGVWQSTRWPVRLHGRVGRYELVDSDVKRDVVLGSLTYTAPQWDTVFSATYGQFFFGENAVRLDATKRFGTTHIGLFAKIIAEDDIAGGMKVSLPIGPRKSLRWNRFSFSGSSRWSHALQTTVKFPNTSDNRLQPALLFEPLVDTEIPNYILDSGRLNRFDYEAYLSGSID